jgi:hypothetical protein
MAQYLRVPRILWLSLLVASLLYPAIVLMARANDPEPLAPEVFLLPAFYLASLMTIAMSFLLPRRKLAASFAPFASRVEAGAGGASQPWAGYRSKQPGERELRLSGADLRAVARGYQGALILALALSESVALMGFVLGFLGFPAPFWAPLSAVGTLLIALRFPTEGALFGRLERAHSARVVPRA